MSVKEMRHEVHSMIISDNIEGGGVFELPIFQQFFETNT